MKLLLDTSTFLFMNLGTGLSDRARELLEDNLSELYLSTACTWEIAIKYAKGKLSLPEHPEIYVPSRRELYRITSLPIDEQSVLQIGKIPHLHKDPFDRALVAQAIIHGLPILTADEAIRQYPVRVIW